MQILDKIKTYKLAEIAAQKRALPLREVEAMAKDAPPVRPFAQALTNAAQTGFALIAEIKKASPSRGLIRADFDPASLARAYADGGAACLSVLTDSPSFQGDPSHLQAARAACTLPVLRKDFLYDAYQVAQSRSWGADCILLIMASLSRGQAAELAACARGWGMDVLVEVHNAAELADAVSLGGALEAELGADLDGDFGGFEGGLIGINNRDLQSFEVDLAVTRTLAGGAAGRDIVSESGIFTHEDIVDLASLGVRRFLVGESLMRAEDVSLATRQLLGGG